MTTESTALSAIPTDPLKWNHDHVEQRRIELLQQFDVDREKMQAEIVALREVHRAADAEAREHGAQQRHGAASEASERANTALAQINHLKASKLPALEVERSRTAGGDHPDLHRIRQSAVANAARAHRIATEAALARLRKAQAAVLEFLHGDRKGKALVEELAQATAAAGITGLVIDLAGGAS